MSTDFARDLKKTSIFGATRINTKMDLDRQTPVTSTRLLAAAPPKMTAAPAGSVAKPHKLKAGVTGTAAGTAAGGATPAPTGKDQYSFLESTKPTKEIKRWSKEQDGLLTAAVKEFGEKNWKAIADRVPQRTDSQERTRLDGLSQS